MTTHDESALTRPLHDLVLLRPATTPQTHALTRPDGTRVELLMPTVAQHERPYGRVLACGEACKLVHEGDIVLYDHTHARRLDGHDTLEYGKGAMGNNAPQHDALVLVPESDVLATLEE